VPSTRGATYDSSMGGARVLVVDDDPTVAEVVVTYLRDADFEVDYAADGKTALELFADAPPDLVVLDLMLPGIDGLDVCSRMRAVRETPIIMLTALGAESDRVVGLERGADDYVTKPFSPRELVLRVRSVLRRSGTGSASDATGGQLADGDLMVDLAARRVTKAGGELGLTGREFDLLVFFLRHSGIAFSREQLLEQVWGWTFGDQSTVTVHVRRLREKVEPDPSSPTRLVTVWGIGYRWESAA
jgi:DNA-binding response OmpR family regulator